MLVEQLINALNVRATSENMESMFPRLEFEYRLSSSIQGHLTGGWSWRIGDIVPSHVGRRTQSAESARLVSYLRQGYTS